MEYFVISAKFEPAEIPYTLIATTASSLVFCWVFGSANSVTRPDQYNAKMVYICDLHRYRPEMPEPFAIFILVYICDLHILMKHVRTYACLKGHLEPIHLKSSPLFTFSTKSLG